MKDGSYLEKVDFFCFCFFKDIFCVAYLFLYLEEDTLFGLIVIWKQYVDKKSVLNSS